MFCVVLASLKLVDLHIHIDVEFGCRRDSGPGFVTSEARQARRRRLARRLKNEPSHLDPRSESNSHHDETPTTTRTETGALVQCSNEQRAPNRTLQWSLVSSPGRRSRASIRAYRATREPPLNCNGVYSSLTCSLLLLLLVVGARFQAGAHVLIGGPNSQFCA